MACAIMANIGDAAMDQPASKDQTLSEEPLHGEDTHIG